MSETSVDEAQGYLFSRPVPVRELVKLLDPASLRELVRSPASRKVA
jgi:EAL domain-containing protein (putative c-di-GMP-specific phosphodiesterase class I)